MQLFGGAYSVQEQQAADLMAVMLHWASKDTEQSCWKQTKHGAVDFTSCRIRVSPRPKYKQ